MDTGTHLVFGLGLGGLAMTDPALAEHAYGPIAVMIGTVAGSQAPDLDGLLRFKSNADYIRNHRGLSHSIPAVLGWSVFFTLLVAALFPTVPRWHLAFWITLAVVIHVFTDLFNSYGTQAWRPFSRQWVAWNIIHIFDPVIFAAHVAALALWALGWAAPQVVFPTLYGLLALYYVWRTLEHRRLSRKLPALDPGRREGDRYVLLPTISLYRWNVVRESTDGWFGIGELEQGKLKWVDRLRCERHPALDASRKLPEVQALLTVTRFACGQVQTRPWGYEARWVDVRYHYRKQYPFVAVVVMNDRYEPMQSYVGWLSDARLEKRLRMNTY